MIPLSLVTGFLGSGKTTFLRRVLESNRARRVVYLVNEFNPTDIDGRRLALPPGQLVTIAGGSIFCRCLVTEFVAALREVRCAFGGQVEAVVVEASGIASPKVIHQMLGETRLAAEYQVSSIVTLVDPGTFLKLLRTLPNITAQVEAADVVLVNKTDVNPPELVARTTDEVRKINPRAQIIRTQHSAADLDLFTPGAIRRSRGEYARCADPNFCTLDFAVPEGTDWEELRNRIATLADRLYRVKGFVRTPAGPRYVDFSAGRWSEEPAAEPAACKLVVIARGDARPQVEEFLERVRIGE